MLLIVLISLSSTAVEALLTVEQIRGLHPYVTQLVDVECHLAVAILDDDVTALRHGVTHLGIADALVFHQLSEVGLITVGHLYHHARILGKECLHDVAVLT